MFIVITCRCILKYKLKCKYDQNWPNAIHLCDLTIILFKKYIMEFFQPHSWCRLSIFRPQLSPFVPNPQYIQLFTSIYNKHSVQNLEMFTVERACAPDNVVVGYNFFKLLCELVRLVRIWRVFCTLSHDNYIFMPFQIICQWNWWNIFQIFSARTLTLVLGSDWLV